jgi:hypothetical protein
MHPLVLASLRNSVQPLALPRIESRRKISIIQAFQISDGMLCWVAKESVEAVDRNQLRCEYEALKYLQPWAQQFGIPQLIQWEDTPERSCLIRTAKNAKTDSAALPLSASRSMLEYSYRKPMDWLLRFVRAVPPPQTRSVGEMCGYLRDSLENYRPAGPGITSLIQLLNSDPAGVWTQPGIALHGDFFPRNVLLNGNELYVIDWDHFSAGLPLVDLLNYFSGADIYNPLTTSACPIDHIVLSCSFGNLPMQAYFMDCIKQYGYPSEAVRYYYYSAVARQIVDGSRMEAHRWIRVIEKLAPLGFPSPGTYLPDVSEEWKSSA